MRKLKIGINGFGRIGRIASRIILNRSNLELVTINSRSDSSSHAYLLKYDSTYGTLPQDVRADHNSLVIDGKKISVFNYATPGEIPWDTSGIDIVIDSTGKFRTQSELKNHLKNGVKYVVLSAPAKDETKTFVLGVNHASFNSTKDTIISNSSCTTNCLATTLKVLDDNFKVKRAFMTTIHAVTDSQNLLDNSHNKEVRLRRASLASMIPASTGSARDIGKLFPDLSGKIICQAIRVPLLTVSLINLSCEIEVPTDKEMVNQAFKKSEERGLKGILATSKLELVSKDYTGSPYSSIVDTFLTQVNGGNLVNVYAWYDNEWGYTSRLIDMLEFVGKKANLI
ncbi:type I glyceraldehyde-3-phosphate dehydrogenase [Candidatus Gottesmanbacteria bacterium RIFCSPLOWO2_01_FULL_39_12b]|uniref:Glyceraldehyde-3-phosphate dehydrogenase n=1 Tax=Candidatus Gottesmanbacteria bacterium RIFCSPLOWO2_01_FULL_39_12b TaxID=1798388 RepID=A0A1F6AQB1_9BACT|nr:MAG: type I glyceraldehyde-3-phosphate dehydrogenase [Candidatus Gottesmanbacteria bacterium RIFCSPLOWO2_01_FULL_39_12b]